MTMMVSQITSLTSIYSIIYSDADQRKHQSSTSLSFVRGIHRGPVNSPHKWPVTRKMFPLDDVIMNSRWLLGWHYLSICCKIYASEFTSIAECKTVVSPLIIHRRYQSLILSHQHIQLEGTVSSVYPPGRKTVTYCLLVQDCGISIADTLEIPHSCLHTRLFLAVFSVLMLAFGHEAILVPWQLKLISAHVNTLRPEQNGRHFTDNVFKFY